MDPPPTKSHLNHVVLDGVRGQLLGGRPRAAPRARRPRRCPTSRTSASASRSRTSTRAGRHEYVPDFLVRLVTEPDDVERTLIIEVSGSRKSPGPTAAKADDRPRPVVRRRQQLGRVRALGLRRDRQPGAGRPGSCSTPPSTTSTPTTAIIGLGLTRGTDAARRRKKPTGPTPVEAITHADKRANLPTADAQDFVAPGDRAARPGALPARPDARPAARLEGQGRARRRGPRRRRAADLHPGEDRPAGARSRTCAAPPARPEDEPELTLFETFDGLDELDLVEFYHHEANWSNRMILGDSLNVMASLAEREALRGKVQMIYIDPPYGIKFGTNWQVVGPQARRQGRQARGRHPRGRADQGLPRHVGAGHPLVPDVPARSAARRAGPADRERLGASSRSATRTCTSCGR